MLRLDIFLMKSCIYISFILCMTGGFSSSIAQDRAYMHLNSLLSVRLWNPERSAPVRLVTADLPTILVLLSPECPMSVSYTRTLSQLQKEFHSLVRMFALVPGSTYSDEKVMTFSKEYGLNFPIYADRKLALTKKLKATVTPEAFLFNASGNLVYSGAIDDWLQELGKKKTKPEQHYLKDALLHCLNGEPSPLPYVTPQGCLINDF